MTRNYSWSRFVAALLLCFLPAPASAAPHGLDVVRGVVRDAETGAPLAGVVVRAVELGRSSLTNSDGIFTLDGLPSGSVTLAATRVGYAPAELRVEVGPETGRVEIRMTASALELPGIVATGTARERLATNTYQSTTVVEGSELGRQLGGSVAATLAGEPGLSERYNGPAAAQPVIRGLGGDRVLVLEDGNRTGDLAAAAGDHAVTIEPLTAERIEVLRGPAGLLYGSNAIGGVINVIRDEVPREPPSQTQAVANLQAESVNQGLVAGGSVLSGMGALAVRGELTGRIASDTRTPLGDLHSSDLSGYNGAVGASYVGQGGYFGASFRDYSLLYGVPGHFEEEDLAEGEIEEEEHGHGDGVDIDLDRRTLRTDGAWYPRGGFIHAVELDASWVDFSQRELEHADGVEAVGTRFDQSLATARLVTHHHHRAVGTETEGAIGGWFEWRDLQAAGEEVNTVPASHLTFAGFGYEEFQLGRGRVQLGGRYDWARIEPQGLNEAGELPPTRSMGAFSGSLAGRLEFAGGISAGASLARSFRTPSIEELYSDGPHLASYSFDVGNSELDPEYGIGADLFVRLARRTVTAEATLFRNWLRDYIYYAPTGEIDPVFGRYPVYRASQTNAVLQGAEGEIDLEVSPGWVLGGSASYVRGSREDGEPLPAMPPFSGNVHLRYDRTRFFGGTEVRMTAAQERTGEFETPTDGYSLLGAYLGVRTRWLGQTHTLTLSAENLLDTVWRDHLSRIREISPQPGRNVKLLYRVEI